MSRNIKPGDMRERIALYSINTPQGPHHIFNPTHDDVELIRKVWTKREDSLTITRWAMVTQNAIDRVQFIIRYRSDLPEDMAIEHRGKLYTVFAKPELGNKQQWLLLLAGRLGINVNGDTF